MRTLLKKNKDNFALQNALKLFLNTFYGVLCSCYFSINNTLVGELITSAIRANAWLLSKSLFMYIIICDGGISQLNQALFFKGPKKPGFHFYSSNYNFFNPPSGVYLAPLGGVNWDPLFKDLKNFPYTKDDLNKIIMDHVTSFWANYNLKITFGIELKHLIIQGK